MRCLLALVLICLPLAVQAQGAKSVDIAIVVSLDRSESIDIEDARAQVDGLVFTLRHSRFHDAVTAGWFGPIRRPPPGTRLPLQSARIWPPEPSIADTSVRKTYRSLIPCK